MKSWLCLVSSNRNRGIIHLCTDDLWPQFNSPNYVQMHNWWIHNLYLESLPGIFPDLTNQQLSVLATKLYLVANVNASVIVIQRKARHWITKALSSLPGSALVWDAWHHSPCKDGLNIIVFICPVSSNKSIMIQIHQLNTVSLH